VSDAAIEASFRTRLTKSKLAADGIKMGVKNGVATLTGRVEVMQHKGSATRMAKSSGATSVVNRIEISAAARQKAVDRMNLGKRNRQARSDERGPATPASVPPPKAVTATSGGDKRTNATAAAPPQTTPPPPVRRAQIRH